MFRSDPMMPPPPLLDTGRAVRERPLRQKSIGFTSAPVRPALPRSTFGRFPLDPGVGGTTPPAGVSG
jgi:hypothetical protein